MHLTQQTVDLDLPALSKATKISCREQPSIATYSLSSFIFLHTGQDSTSAFGLTSKAKQQNVVFILGKTDVS